MQWRQFLGHPVTIGVGGDVTEPGLGRYRELFGIVKPFIEERTLAMHLVDCDEGVPVRDRPPGACPRMQVVTREAPSIGYQSCPWDMRPGDNSVCYLLWVESFTVEKQLSIEFTGTPSPQNRSNLVRGNVGVHYAQ